MLVPLRLRYGRFGVSRVPLSRYAALRREELAPRTGERHDAGARRDEVRLGDEVDGRRTARAIRRDLVVPAGQRPLGAVGADGQHPRRVARRRDGAVLRLLLEADRSLAEVARRGDDHDAGIDRTLGGECQRIGLVRLGDARAHREVDDADVVRHAVGDRPLEGGDDVADDAGAVLIEHLQADDVRRRRHAGMRAVGIVAVAGDDPRDVRPVPVVVVGGRQPLDEVDEARDALTVDDADRARRALVGEVVVPAGDAGVDDRHADAGAGVAPLLLCRANARRHRRAVIVPGNRTVVVDAQNLRALGDHLDDPIRELDGHAVDELEAPAEPTPELLDLLLGVGFLPRLHREDHLGGAEQAARARAHFLVELRVPVLLAGVPARLRLARKQLADRA